MPDTKVISETPDHAPQCPQCGTPLPGGALAGLCPACLLKSGAAADTVTEVRQPAFIPPSIAELAPLIRLINSALLSKRPSCLVNCSIASQGCIVLSVRRNMVTAS